MILYEDDYILALNKPSGTAVHGGSGLNFGIIESLRVLRPKTKFLELIHRLDRDTSGVLLIAKKRSMLLSLHKQFREKKIKKDYLALVRGLWQPNLKVIQEPLLKNIMKNGERIVQVNQKGKISETFFKIEEYYKFSTLMRCRPTTGRTHQIRVHLQHVGHPIAFDNRYGDRNFDKQLKKLKSPRLFLHATKMKFFHPRIEKTICIEAPLDEKLKKYLKILRKY